MEREMSYYEKNIERITEIINGAYAKNSLTCDGTFELYHIDDEHEDLSFHHCPDDWLNGVRDPDGDWTDEQVIESVYETLDNAIENGVLLDFDDVKKLYMESRNESRNELRDQNKE